MAQQSRIPHDFSVDLDHDVALLPTRPAAYVPPTFPAPPGGRAIAAPKVGVRTHAIRGVVVLEVAGRLSAAVVEDLDRAIQLALAEVPRGVVCDLSGVLEGAEPATVEVLAAAGRHVRDWSGIPVAVACPDPRVRAALADHPLGGHLIVTESVFCAVSAVLAIPIPAVEWLRLAPHPTAQRASREFVTRTLLDWGLDQFILSADLVVSELVSSSTMQATTGVTVSVAWNLGALRLTVGDNSPHLPRARYTHFDLYGSRLTAVAGLSRAFGVLPSADGGKVVWAVLNAVRPFPQSDRRRPEPATAHQESPMLTDAPGTAGLPLFALSSPIPS
jgi:hypothetical protein